MPKQRGQYDQHMIGKIRFRKTFMPMGLLPLAVVVLMLVATTRMVATAQSQPYDCKERCGNVSIPYPFGLTDGCYLHVPGQDSQQFKLVCNTATPSQPTLNFLDTSNYPSNISNIIPSESALQVMVITSVNCYNGTVQMYDEYSDLSLPPTYTLADKNKLFNIGCNKVTKIEAQELHATKTTTALSGASFCQDEFGKTFPDTCTGFGCSVSDIPSQVQSYRVGVWTIGTGVGTTIQWSLDYPCSYGFVVDERNFTFVGNLSFYELNQTRSQLPVLADWAIGYDNCEAAKKKNATAFACKGVNTKCVDRADGYFCQCNDGYEGNPYLLNDCQDVDECKNTTLCSGHATCVNSIGSYKCVCHSGYRKDDHDQNKCVLITETSDKNSKAMKVSLSVCLSFLVVVSITFWMYHVCKKSKFKRLTNMYIERNGNSLLQEKLKTYQGTRNPRPFTQEELKKATNNFSVAKGDGTYSSVYKGTLADKSIVAVKKSRSDSPTVVSQSQWQFVNELLFLSLIDHKNFMKLIGYCLESRTPMLVYEFVGNGTLGDHIHKRKGKGPLSLWQRMKIATEIAGSIANLHYHESIQIKYQDQERCRVSQPKTKNILLDENLTAKVSDFTASNFVPLDPSILGADGQAAFVYVDPEYFETRKLTEKSDVYSYGVILVELLTSLPLATFEKTEAEKDLVKYFRTCMEVDQLESIIDKEIIKDEESVTIAQEVAKLAVKYLSLNGVDRPTMQVVETEVRAIWEKCPTEIRDLSHTDTQYLLAASPSNDYTVYVKSDD